MSPSTPDGHAPLVSPSAPDGHAPLVRARGRVHETRLRIFRVCVHLCVPLRAPHSGRACVRVAHAIACPSTYREDTAQHDAHKEARQHVARIQEAHPYHRKAPSPRPRCLHVWKVERHVYFSRFGMVGMLLHTVDRHSLILLHPLPLASRTQLGMRAILLSLIHI